MPITYGDLHATFMRKIRVENDFNELFFRFFGINDLLNRYLF